MLDLYCLVRLYCPLSLPVFSLPIPFLPLHRPLSLRAQHATRHRLRGVRAPPFAPTAGTAARPCWYLATFPCTRAAGRAAAHVALHTAWFPACSRSATREHTPRRCAVHAAHLPCVRLSTSCTLPPFASFACCTRTIAPPLPIPAPLQRMYLTTRRPARPNAQALNCLQQRAEPWSCCRGVTPRATPIPRTSLRTRCGKLNRLYGGTRAPLSRHAPTARGARTCRPTVLAHARAHTSAPPWRHCLCSCGHRAGWRAAALLCASAHAPPARPRSRTLHALPPPAPVYWRPLHCKQHCPTTRPAVHCARATPRTPPLRLPAP